MCALRPGRGSSTKTLDGLRAVPEQLAYVDWLWSACFLSGQWLRRDLRNMPTMVGTCQDDESAATLANGPVAIWGDADPSSH